MGNVESLEEFFRGGRDFLTTGFLIASFCETFFDEGGLLLRCQLVAGGLQLLVEILELFSRVSLMLGEIKRSTRGNPFQFLGSEGKLEKDVNAGACVVGQVFPGLPVVIENL